MNFAQIAADSTVFLDANTFIYALVNHPAYGASCSQLLDRIERKEVYGTTSAQVLSDTVHRMMTVEAQDRFGWPAQGIANRLRRHPGEIQQLLTPRRAFDEINSVALTVIPVTAALVSQAVDLSHQYGLLSGDALIVSAMRDHGFVQLASLDADFDRVPGIRRFSPV